MWHSRLYVDPQEIEAIFRRSKQQQKKAKLADLLGSEHREL